MSVETVQAGVSAAAWDALQGAYDLQVHVAPDVIERRIDDLDLAKEFLGARAEGVCAEVALFPYGGARERRHESGSGDSGVRRDRAESQRGRTESGGRGAGGAVRDKIVWMPTVDAANETAGRPDGTKTKLPFWAKIQLELAATGINPPPMTVIDADGNCSAAARTVPGVD